MSIRRRGKSESGVSARSYTESLIRGKISKSEIPEHLVSLCISMAEITTWHIAKKISLIKTKESRQEALSAVPESIRDMVKAHAIKIFCDSRRESGKK